MHPNVLYSYINKKKINENEIQSYLWILNLHHLLIWLPLTILRYSIPFVHKNKICLPRKVPYMDLSAMEDWMNGQQRMQMNIQTKKWQSLNKTHVCTHTSLCINDQINIPVQNQHWKSCMPFYNFQSHCPDKQIEC